MRSVIYEPDARVLSGFKIFTALAAAVVILASLFVLTSWMFDISQLKGLFPSLETTKPLGALGFLLAGTALLLLHHKEEKTKSLQRFIGKAFAGLAFLIGSLVLLEYGLGIDFGIDRWLFREAVMAQSGPFPGRPILAVSVCLAIMGLALMAIHSRVIWFDLLVFAVLFIGLVALTGYLYSSAVLFSLNTYQSLPLASVFVIIILALGYLSARPESVLLAPITASLAGGIVARRLLPATILFPLGLVWLRLIGQRIGLYNDELSKVLFASASMVVFAVLVYWNAMKLNDADIQRDAVLATLEQRVDERTRQLEFERARWQGIVEGIADEVWSCDAQGRMSLLNLGTVTAMGIKSFKDKSIEEIYQEVDLSYPNGQPRPPEQAPLLRSLRGEIVRGEEIMRHRRIGLTRYRQFSSAPTVDATGAITGAVAIVRDITEQKHAEEGLHRFELLSEYSKDIVLFMRREDGRILDANLAAQRAYGYSRDELLSLTVRKLRARGTRELTGDQVIQADQEGILYETVHQRKEGSNFPVEVSSQGAVIGGVPTLINIVRDITERKQAEAKLEYQAELLASVRDAVVGTDEKLQVSFWNAAAEEMFGWKSDEVIGKETAQLFKTQIRGYSREEAIQKLMTIGEFDGEVSYARKDDSRFIGHARSIVLRGPQGDFNGLVTTVRDITERKQAEEAVQRSEAMLRTVLDQMPSGVTVRDARTSELLLSNTRSQEIMGSLANTPNQYAQYRGLHPDGLPYQGEGWPLSSSMATGDVVHAEEVNFTRSDGSQYTLSINSAPIRDSQGQIVMAVAVFDDITERKQAEEQLSAALQEKVVLLKEIHHRVKNNLQVISSLLRLQSTASGDPQVREFLADSQRRVRAMALIHEQLYQSSNLAQINFKDYIQKLVHYLRRSYTQAISNVEVRVTVEDINIEIEQAVPLGLIISELVSNSLKHAFSSLQSKQTGEVWITAQRESLGDLFLSVGDNGAGMPENLDLEHSPTLGLQLVQSFVDQLQGQLTVQRKPGTIFTITIPEKKD